MWVFRATVGSYPEWKCYGSYLKLKLFYFIVSACDDELYGTMCTMSCSPGCARCDQQSGNCTTCTSNSNLAFPGCTECEDGYYKQTAPPCIQCPGTCDNNSSCDKTTGHCQQCPPGKKGDTCNEEKTANQNDNLVVPMVSSVIGAGVIIAIAVVGSVCWYRRSRGGPAAKHGTRSPVNEPGNALGDNGTASLGRQPPSSSSPQEDAAYYEISDTAKTHEMQEVENNYDALHPYSNDDADRQPYSQIKSHPSDVTKPSANAAYVNTAFHNIRGTNNM
ncbi:hypothetical protein V1264_019831 [Littorina saxatilis]|uniref:Uncharacterized protein n=1 Tax=Littorina saxatilis TaxID=31220 RepID=A0AAN9GBG1_9CAEN